MEGTMVFVRWYGDILHGEVVENDRQDQLAGMVAVRIPVQGVRITALFHPQHVYQSKVDAVPMEFDPAYVKNKTFEITITGHSPIISPDSPKVATEEREISRTLQKEAKSYIADEYVSVMIQRFKESHWDEAHNHLRIDALDEFYRLWLKTHDHRDSKTTTITEISLSSNTPKRHPLQLDLFS